MDTTGLSSGQEWRRGFPMVAAAFVGFSFLTLQTASLSMFIEPLSAEFDWSRTFISLGFTIATLFTALLSPFVGALVDRIGSRKLAIPGIITTAIAICAFSLADGSAALWIGLWIFYAIISISIKPTVWTAAVAGMFSTSQGLALGVTISGMAAAQVIVPPLANFLIDELGWRHAYLALGIGWGGIALLLSWFFLFDAHDHKRKDSNEAGSNEAYRAPGLTIAQAWRNRALWHIAGSTFIILTLTSGLFIHLIAILSDAGISRSYAALLGSLTGVSAICAKLLTGVLLDRYSPRLIGSVALASAAFAFIFLTEHFATPFFIVTAILINGYAQGTKFQICSFLTAQYAGLRNYGSIYGFMNSLIALGGGIGPLLAGASYDMTGSYDTFLVAGAVGSIIAGILVLTLPARPKWDGEESIPATPTLQPAE